ncbi:hypothetical protein [Ensifer sp.]|uniref:hypothetical protein n=1 Tax=Ensifer sp. TaxID=1872086 RepID=UPI0028966273|nr:hypothetical protein [Ensifer sp.]
MFMPPIHTALIRKRSKGAKSIRFAGPSRDQMPIVDAAKCLLSCLYVPLPSGAWSIGHASRVDDAAGGGSGNLHRGNHHLVDLIRVVAPAMRCGRI